MCAVCNSQQHRFEGLESRILFAVGDLDTTFNGSGFVGLDLLGSDDFGFAVAVQSDGKVLVAGRTWTGSTNGNDFAVIRFNANGTLDTTFGSSGIVITNMGASSDSVYAIAVQSDGKIVVAGETMRSGFGSDFAVARYNSNGSLDSTFGSGGKVFTDFNTDTDQAKSIAFTSTGQILVAGTATVASESRMALAKYNSNGTLDTTFGTGGKVTIGFAGGSARGDSVAMCTGGAIVIAGSVFDNSTGLSDFAVAKYSSTGALDTTFGASGLARIDLGGDDSAHAVAVQSNGRIVVAGEYYNSDTGVGDFGVARLLSNGSLDTSFSGGTVLTDFAGDYDQGTSMALQSDGRIVVGGTASVDGIAEFGLARYNSDGTLDSTFNGGRVTVAIAEAAVANAVAIDANGQILTAGFRVDEFGNFDIAAARVVGKFNLPPAANPGGSYVVNVGGSTMVSGAGSSDADGSIVSYQWDFNYDGSSFDVDGTGMTANFSGAGLPAGTVRTIALRVTDDNGATTIATTTVRVNLPPTANPGGSHVVLPGGSLVLNGNGSSDSDGSIVSYEWDFNYNGTTFDVDATGAAPTFSAAGLSGVVRTIALRVTDNNGAVHIATTTLRVDAPPLANPGGPYLVLAGGSIVLIGSGSDSDGSIASYQWDFNYNGSTFDVDATGASPTFSAAGLSGVTRTIALRVTDNDGAVHIATATLKVNAPPTANPGGPYLVIAGGTLVLSGAGSSDSDGSIASWQWDFNYDGTTFDVDASGAAPTFSAAGLSGLVRTIALRVTDSDGATHLATTTVRVNALPTSNPGGPYHVDANGSVVVDGSGSTDVDGSIVTYQWDFNYDGTHFDNDATGTTSNFSAAGLSGVTRTIALRVTDNNGATSITTTTVVVNVLPPPPPGTDPTPGSVVVKDDPAGNGKKILFVYGTSKNDDIRVREVKGGKVEVRLGNKVLGTFANVSRVVAFGADGNDLLSAMDSPVPVDLFGGNGNDLLQGSRFCDVLVGGDGNDQLMGGRGDDLEVGGAGEDNLYTAYGDDAMVGDSLSFENDVLKLRAALNDWKNKSLPLQKRVAKLVDGLVDDNKKDKFHFQSKSDYALDTPIKAPQVKAGVGK